MEKKSFVILHVLRTLASVRDRWLCLVYKQKVRVRLRVRQSLGRPWGGGALQVFELHRISR